MEGNPMLTISKSRFMAGRQCTRRIWQEINARDRKTPDSEARKFIFQQGHEVGAFAQQWRGPGRLIDLDHRNPGPSIEATRQALADGERRIYEAGFEAEGFRAFADIIEQLDDGSWRLIEVKATTRAKDEHVPDLAFQAWLMECNGLAVSEAGVVHLNRQAVWPERELILTYTDMAGDVLQAMKNVPEEARSLAAVAAQADEPRVLPGRHCNKPYECPFKAHCWAGLPEDHLLVLPRLALGKEISLRKQGWHRVSAIGDASALSPHQQAWVQAIQSGQPVIDKAAIRTWLGRLSAPIHSLDFETISYALPRWDGMHPYQRAPFQFSCHTRTEDGEIRHKEFLHATPTDPRPALIEALLQAVGDQGTLLVWNAAFERGVIEELARDFPADAGRLKALVPRIADLMDVYGKWYLHPRALGSASIKRVGSAILGEKADYASLEISQGDEASVQWHHWVFGNGPAERGDQLRRYCARDTELPLRLLSHIEAL
jgi:hypothetical protein